MKYIYTVNKLNVRITVFFLIESVNAVRCRIIIYQKYKVSGEASPVDRSEMDGILKALVVSSQV